MVAGSVSTTDALTYTYNAAGTQLAKVSDDGGDGGFLDGNRQGDDYTYDAIGNLTADKNKGITNISYNILDLPEEITFADGTVIRNTYLVDGTRIKQELFENGTGSPATKTTDYEGRLLYEDNSLALAHHAEGRAIPIRDASTGEIADWDYQYHLTDHQGNTRVTVSATPENYTLVETFETGESNGFQDLHRFVHETANTTPEGNEVELLQIGQTGAMAMLRVDPRDTVQLSVHANYEVAPSGNSHVPIGFSALFSSFDAIYGGAEGIASQASDFSDALSGVEMIGKGSASTAPRAFLNYIFFDTTMAYVTAGFKQISTAAQGIDWHDQDSGVYELVELDEPFIADQQGYVLVYLSNENQEAVNIHFDDFTVYHGKTNVVQSQDYYPFGGSFNAFTRNATRPNEYLYNGGVELNEKTNYYETAFRQYDPLIGRFTAIDPLASQFSSWTPYQYAFNDPIYYNDPLGLAPYGALSEGDVEGSGGGGAGNRSGIGGWDGFGSVSSFGWGNWAVNNRSAHQNANLMSRAGFNSFYGITDQNRASFAASLGNAPTGEQLRGIVDYIWRLEHDFLDRIMIDHPAAGLIHIDMNSGGAWLLPHTNISYWDYLALGQRLSGDPVATRKWMQGGFSLTSRYGAGPVPLVEGAGTREINIDHLGGSAGGKSQVSTFWKGIAESLNRIRKLAGESNWRGTTKTAAQNVAVSPSPTQPVPVKVDSFISTRKSFFLGDGTLNHSYQGYATDGVDTSRFMMYPDSSFFEYDTYYNESLPTKVVKIN